MGPPLHDSFKDQTTPPTITGKDILKALDELGIVGSLMPGYSGIRLAAGEVTPGNIVDTGLDILPGSAVRKLAPLAAMTLHPKTIGKFAELMDKIIKSLPEDFPQKLKVPYAFLKTRYPTLFDKVSKHAEKPLHVKVEARYLPSAIEGGLLPISNPEEAKILLNKSFIRDTSKAALARTLLHELIHAQQSYFLNHPKSRYVKALVRGSPEAAEYHDLINLINTSMRRYHETRDPLVKEMLRNQIDRALLRYRSFPFEAQALKGERNAFKQIEKYNQLLVDYLTELAEKDPEAAMRFNRLFID
ncbi:MAG: hypothetical protein ACUVQP_00075 [Bacteroidales bacterium]